jgi:membrane-associated HD superfamily phosphohydrolase
MKLTTLYLLSTVLLVVGVAGWALAARRRLERFTTRDLTTLAMMMCLLHVVLLPFRSGLSHIPGLDALIYAIPYTVVLLVGLRLTPKPGAASCIIIGQGLLGQLLGHGLNPVMWPYFVWCAWSVEALLLVTGPRLRSLPQALALACLRGLVSNGYSYLLLAPLVWRQHYDAWYVALKIGLGLVGCVIGAILGWGLGPRVEQAAQNPVG